MCALLSGGLCSSMGIMSRCETPGCKYSGRPAYKGVLKPTLQAAYDQRCDFQSALPAVVFRTQPQQWPHNDFPRT